MTGESSVMLYRAKSGKMIGSTIENKRLESERMMNVRNETAGKYRVVSDEAQRGRKNVRKEHLSELVNEVVKKRRKIEHVNIPLKTIYQ